MFLWVTTKSELTGRVSTADTSLGRGAYPAPGGSLTAPGTIVQTLQICQVSDLIFLSGVIMPTEVPVLANRVPLLESFNEHLE